MKKLFASMTAIALVGAMMVPLAAFADGENTIIGPASSGTANAIGQVAAAYSVTIPATVTINGGEAEVSVSGANCYVTITAAADADGAVWTNAEKLDNPVSGASFVVNTYGLTDLAPGDNMTFGYVSAQWNNAPNRMGTYYGTINFNVTASATPTDATTDG